MMSKEALDKSIKGMGGGRLKQFEQLDELRQFGTMP